MTDNQDHDAPSIAALPPQTVRQIGSSQALSDPTSVVKELIDNALDARATAIFVDISVNAIDTIQVKDTGHGIPEEDLPLVCRRYCTSKIRHFDDVKGIGGNWLGFRGTAMANIVEMSGALEITTRVEGERIAHSLKYGRDGEIVLPTQVTSAPVGTTVKITDFFQHLPVRRQNAPTQSAKWLAKIKRIMQAYALARPSVRFRLHILKADTKSDFVYAPKPGASFEDSALKVVGRGVLQCNWTTFSADGFEVHALLPKSDADVSKISNEGAFVSIDSRPVSTSRGALKQILAQLKNRISKVNPNLASTRNIFFYMNIICPPGSYDPNIEPLKDNVLFEDGDKVLDTVDKLLMAFYVEGTIATAEDDVVVVSPQPILGEEALSRLTSPSMCEDSSGRKYEGSNYLSENVQVRWRPNMYGIDEEDLELLSDNQLPVVEEDDCCADISVRNPWTTAKMNAATKPRRKNDDEQPITPAMSREDSGMCSSSPLKLVVRRQRSIEPLTPQPSSQNNTQSIIEFEHIKSIRNNETYLRETWDNGNKSTGFSEGVSVSCPIFPVSGSGSSITRGPDNFTPGLMETPQTQRVSRMKPPEVSLPPSMPTDGAPSVVRTKHRTGQGKRPFKPVLPSSPKPSRDMWFGQPMPGAQTSSASRKKMRMKGTKESLLTRPRNAARMINERLIDDTLGPENNNDIREFFPPGRKQPQGGLSAEFHITSSFTPINQLPKRRNQSLQAEECETMDCVETCTENESLPVSRHMPTPTEDTTRSKTTRHRNGVYSDNERVPESIDLESQLHAFANRSGGASSPPRPRSDSTSTSTTAPDPRDVAAIFEAHASRIHLPNKPTLSTTRRKSRNRFPHEKLGSYRQSPGPRSTGSSLNRTRSSRLPLERVPQGSQTRNLVLSLSLAIPTIVQSMRKLDMSRNTPEWGHPADEAYAEFATPVAEWMLKGWVLRVTSMLDVWWEREEVDVEEVIEAGLRDVLQSRNAGKACEQRKGEKREVGGDVMIHEDFQQSYMGGRENGRNGDKDSGHGSDEYEDDGDDEMLMDILAESHVEI